MLAEPIAPKIECKDDEVINQYLIDLNDSYQSAIDMLKKSREVLDSIQSLKEEIAVAKKKCQDLQELYEKISGVKIDLTRECIYVENGKIVFVNSIPFVPQNEIDTINGDLHVKKLSKKVAVEAILKLLEKNQAIIMEAEKSLKRIEEEEKDLLKNLRSVNKKTPQEVIDEIDSIISARKKKEGLWKKLPSSSSSSAEKTSQKKSTLNLKSTQISGGNESTNQALSEFLIDPQNQTALINLRLCDQANLEGFVDWMVSGSKRVKKIA